MPIRFPNGPMAVLIPTLALVLLALFPQVGIWMLKGSAWQGSYFVSNYDEPAYSAYVNSLINGRPRKNDPFLGRPDGLDSPQPETLYSIQFIPAYSIALPARILGINVSTAFIFLAILIAIASTLAIYGLLIDVTGGDRTVSLAGPVIILCLGTAFAFQGELRYLIEGRVLTDYLPFLRRYQPGVAFPLFFVFCLLVWKAVRSETSKQVATYALAAGGIFAILVFSYFYLWTAAAAWLVCLTLISIILDRTNFRRTVLLAATIVGLVGLVALVPYFYLLTQRSADLESVQLLSHTRVPEFASPSMVLGLIVAVVAVFLLRRGSEDGATGSLTLIVSFAITPVILFNQQVLTGRSLQPVHYELFIANYLVLTAAVLLVAALRSKAEGEIQRAKLDKLVTYAGLAAFGCGLFEAYGSTARNLTPAEIRDASLPAIEAAVKQSAAPPVVHATNFVTADIIPSIGAARPLWNSHISSAGGIGIEENRRLFYLFLYFSGYTHRDLEAALRVNSFEVTAAIFGSERALPWLAGGAAKVTQEEIGAEVAKFDRLARDMTAVNAYSPVISYIIVPTEAEPNFANLDRWYSRDEGQNFDLFKLYRVSQREQLP